MYSTRHMYDDEFVTENLAGPNPESFDRWAAELDDVTDVNVKSANLWWGGESSEARGYAKSRKIENFTDCFDIGFDSEQLVFVQENASGKLIRFWLSRDSNVSARVRYVPSTCAWKVDVYMNHRNAEGYRQPWSGTLVATFNVHRTITTESELTVSKYIALEFAKAQAST